MQICYVWGQRMQGMVTCDGTRIAYDVVGTGPPILFIQGVGVPASGWQPQVAGLRERCQCAALDNRGIGRSDPASTELGIPHMAADALAVMDHIGWESSHVVGYSIGGLVAQELALSARKRVRSLTMLCPFHKGRQAS